MTVEWEKPWFVFTTFRLGMAWLSGFLVGAAMTLTVMVILWAVSQ